MTITTLMKIYELLKEDAKIREVEKNVITKKRKARRAKLSEETGSKRKAGADRSELDVQPEKEMETLNAKVAAAVEAFSEARGALEDFEMHDWR